MKSKTRKPVTPIVTAMDTFSPARRGAFKALGLPSLDDEDERQAHWEFTQWYLNKDFAVLDSIEVRSTQHWLPPVQFDESGNDISPFNTVDFKRLHPSQYNHGRAAIRAILNKLQDLAQTHSVISDEEGRANIKRRFDEIVRYDLKGSWRQVARDIWEEGAFAP